MTYPVLEIERAEDPEGVRISLGVRMKLDLAGLRISLGDWEALPAATRSALVEAPAEHDPQVRAFARRLETALAALGRACRPLAADDCSAVEKWRLPGPEPPEVTAARKGMRELPVWDRLDRFGRYVLYSLATRGSRQRFVRAAREICSSLRMPGRH